MRLTSSSGTDGARGSVDSRQDSQAMRRFENRAAPSVVQQRFVGLYVLSVAHGFLRNSDFQSFSFGGGAPILTISINPGLFDFVSEIGPE
jgi:hypothetical protein